MAGTELLAPDAWLARALGRPAFGLRLPLPPAAQLAAALARLPGEALCFAKVPEGDDASSSALEDCGFRQVDTQVTLERAADPAPAAPRVVVRRAEPRDRDAVLDIAGSCFRFSRFHQDARIGLPVAHAVKRAWAANCLDGKRGSELRRGRQWQAQPERRPAERPGEPGVGREEFGAGDDAHLLANASGMRFASPLYHSI